MRQHRIDHDDQNGCEEPIDCEMPGFGALDLLCCMVAPPEPKRQQVARKDRQEVRGDSGNPEMIEIKPLRLLWQSHRGQPLVIDFQDCGVHCGEYQT